MSSDVVISETTPNDEMSPPVSQSLVANNQLAHTLNPTSSDGNPSIANNTSIASNTSNDTNISEDVPTVGPKVDGHHNSQNNNKSNIAEGKRRRTRRARKRKWRLDYRGNKRLQWSESTEAEVRHLHMKVLEHGQPLAPYNTTQFIMNEHNSDKDIDFEAIKGRLHRLKRTEDNDQSGGASNDPNDEDFYSSPEDESDYLQQQFHEAYDNIHAERLSAMNKNELVQEYLQLEDRVEDLERKLKETTNSQTFTSDLITTISSEVQTEPDGHPSGFDPDIQMVDESQPLDDFRQQIQRLSEENQKLRSDNERLKRIVDEQHIPIDSSL